MLSRTVPLFRLFGFPVRLDLSWFIVFFLVIWSLAAGIFPATISGLPATTYWVMGLIGAIGLFASVICHELGHAVVARRYGLAIRGITLFIFGGVAELESEPQSAKVEFLVAIAGPVVSALLALICYGLAGIGPASGLPVAATVVLGYLAFINTAMLVFNLVPAFPLDGGRVLRSALWQSRGNLRWATRVTSWIGAGFGFLLMAFGILSLFAGNLIGGLWIVLIGLFLRNAAAMSYQQLILRQALEGESVRRFMTPEPITVPPSTSLQQLADGYIYRYYHKFFPLVEDGRLVGCVSVDDIKDVPREDWARHRVSEVASQCSDNNTIDADADAMQALAKMSRTNSSRLMVLEDDHLIGMISLKDLMRFFSLKVELEDQPRGSGAHSSSDERQTDRYERARVDR